MTDLAKLRPGEPAVSAVTSKDVPPPTAPASAPAPLVSGGLQLAAYAASLILGALAVFPPLAPFASILGSLGTLALFLAGLSSQVPEWVARNEVLLKALAPTVLAIATSLEAHALTVPGVPGKVLHVVGAVLFFVGAKFVPSPAKR